MELCSLCYIFTTLMHIYLHIQSLFSKWHINIYNVPIICFDIINKVDLLVICYNIRFDFYAELLILMDIIG